jgi:non-specific serine/threonine protein kinase
MTPPNHTFAALNDERADSAMGFSAGSLPAGTLVAEFEVEEIIDEGDATIIYAATDRSLAVPVAIAEYMPALIAHRNYAAQVVPRTAAHADDFAEGLKAFIDETRTLARCDHPSLVRIVGLLEAHATAYRVMPRYLGERLLEARRGMAEPPDERALRALLDALLGALEAFHHTGGFHGRVTPTNILLLADSRPVLLSPGAAGRAIASDRIDALITSQEPSFAPVEQILELADTPLHPSVDLYALAGVARYWISGQLPGPAFGTRDTSREPLAQTIQRLRLTWPQLHYSASLLDALESALSIYPAERPQSVAQMRARLDPGHPVGGNPISPSTAAFALNDAVPLSPAPAARAAQDPDRVMAVAPNRNTLASDDVTRIDDDASGRTVFARKPPKPQRVAMWSGATVLLLALILIALYEFYGEGQIGPALDVLGIRGIGAEHSAAESAAVGPIASVAPPIAANAQTDKSAPTKAADSEMSESMPTATTAAGSPVSAAESAALATAVPADTGTPAEEAAVAQPPGRSPTPLPATQQHALRAPASPRAACGSRTHFSLYRCMQMQCSQRQWASHPQCERLRTTDSVD